MHKKTLSAFIIVSIVASNLFACTTNINKKVINTDTSYYSVTIGSFEKTKNSYMDVDIEVPKITYSNDSSSSLIDPINIEIEESLATMIEESKNKALSTYQTYIESAKENAKKDIENKINNLKEKYKNILGDEEVKLLSEFSFDDLERAPFDKRFIASKSEFKNMRQKRFNGAINDNRSTPSNQNRDKNRKTNNDNDKLRETTVDGIVHGFTNSNELIIPGLHNKNIIVVETTENYTKETTSNANNKSDRIKPSEGDYGGFKNGNNDMFTDDKMPPRNRGTKSEAIKMENHPPQELSTKSEIKPDIIIASHSDIVESFDTNDKNIGLIKDEIDEADIDEEITLDNFYRDFADIYMTRIPDDYTLSMYYIPTTIKCNFEVKCLDEDYLSLFVEISESRTTSMIKRLFYNIDLNQGKIIGIKDFLGENFKENVVKIINSEIDKWSDEQKSTLINNYSVEKYISDDTPFFINNNHRAVIQIEKFAITIGSAGYHEFQIP